MTQIDEPNLDKIDQEITDILLEHLVLANDNGQPYIQYTDVAVDKIITLIANQAREELTNLKIASLNLGTITTDHADGYQMAVDDMNRHIDNRIKELKGN